MRGRGSKQEAEEGLRRQEAEQAGALEAWKRQEEIEETRCRRGNFKNIIIDWLCFHNRRLEKELDWSFKNQKI